MNTPAHLIFGMAAFGKPGRPAITAAALLGALFPDLSLYLMSGWHLLYLGTSPDVVFGQLYFSDDWHRIFRVDNSFVLWGLGLAAAVYARSPVFIAFCAAALLHIAFDFPLHHDDGRAHFWPLTNWIYESPVSYWDRRHYAGIVAPIEMALSLGCAVLLWRRYVGMWMRILVAALCLLEFYIVYVWLFVFAT